MSPRRVVSAAHAFVRSTISLVLVVPALSAQSSTPSLAALLGSPFPTEMSAAPAGGAVAWILNERGARNIWIATPPRHEGRRLTSYRGDDGQEISALTWTPDGSALFFVRGGARNRAGESPNPAHDPAGVESAVWRVALSGGQPERIGGGTAPSVSPRGDALVINRGKLWMAPLGGSKVEPKLLMDVRGGMSNARWSPDGAMLSFVSGRGDHAFIGIYDFAAKSVRFLSPSVDVDGDQVWSPDGKRIAFIRTPSSRQLLLFRAQRSAMPWSIMVADVASGATRAIFTATPGDGSAHRDLVAPDQLMWGTGDRIVFAWERDGWNHLYSLSANGGEATLLTPGAFEVEYARLSRDRREVLFNSNQGDIDRRDIWRVGVGGGTPIAITRGEEIEWSPAETSDGRVAFLRSGARTPAHAVIADRDGTNLRPLAPNDAAGYPASALVMPQAVAITAADGMKIPAQLFLPKTPKPGEKHPAVVFFHGGSRRQMLLGFHYGEYYHNAYALNQYLASRGFVVLSVNYRSGTGYGLAFREAERYGAGGASEFNDVVGAGLYLRSRSDVDSARIGLWGGSYGGYLTAMGLARAPELFAAGVDIHGVHDWNVGIRTFVPDYNKLEVPDDSRLALASSPLAYLDRWKAPVLVIHGDDDRNVSFSETVTLVEELRKRKVEVEQLIFPDEVHSFLRHASWLAAYAATSEFFERRLGVRP